MTSKGKVIRDFIYVDIDRLYSLYSQLFEGVADQIVQSYMDTSSSGKSQKGSILKGSNIEKQVAEMSSVTENKILHDHMYNLLEADLGEAVYEPSGVNRENFRDILKNISLIKIRGRAEIYDYGRIAVFIEKINSLAESFASLTVHSDVVIAAKAELTETLKGMPNSKEKDELKGQLNKLKDAKTFARESGWLVDENMTKALRQILDYSYPDMMQVSIIPSEGVEGVEFGGILDKHWLRIQPEFLRALYGGAVEWTWTMVGQLTYLPGQRPITQVDIDQITNAENPAVDGVSVKGPIHVAAQRLRLLERAALESGTKIEIIISPIAIYRELELPIANRGAVAAESKD